jgi:hypothetical protein
MAMARREHGNSMANATHRHGNHMATAWQINASTWQQHGNSMAKSCQHHGNIRALQQEAWAHAMELSIAANVEFTDRNGIVQNPRNIDDSLLGQVLHRYCDTCGLHYC